MDCIAILRNDIFASHTVLSKQNKKNKKNKKKYDKNVCLKRWLVYNQSVSFGRL